MHDLPSSPSLAGDMAAAFAFPSYFGIHCCPPAPSPSERIYGSIYFSSSVLKNTFISPPPPSLAGDVAVCS